MRKLELHRGERYGSLRYIRDTQSIQSPAGKPVRTALWQCDCGERVVRRLGNIRSGNTTSCGCKGGFPQRTHGLSRHKDRALYVCWANMHARCYNVNDPCYKDYGARGIDVASVWHTDDGLRNFVEWAKTNGYARGLELDRRNNELGYSPDNCRWVTRSRNMRNTRRTLIFVHPKTGRSIALRDLYHRKPRAVTYQTAAARLRAGWPLNRLFV